MDEPLLVHMNDYSISLSKILYDESKSKDQREIDAGKFIIGLYDSKQLIYPSFRIIAFDYVGIISRYSKISNVSILMRRNPKQSAQLHTAFKSAVKDFLKSQLSGNDVQFKRNFINLIRDYGLEQEHPLFQEALDEYLTELKEF